MQTFTKMSIYYVDFWDRKINLFPCCPGTHSLVLKTDVNKYRNKFIAKITAPGNTGEIFIKAGHEKFLREVPFKLKIAGLSGL